MLFSSLSLLSVLSDAPHSGAMNPLLLGGVMGYFAAATLSVTALGLSAGTQPAQVRSRSTATSSLEPLAIRATSPVFSSRTR